jgi:hypothetical protein
VRVPSADPSVIILLADGLRADTLRAAIDAGHVPALAALAAEGALHTVTSVFPSVTGAAYTPFLLGRYPGSVGVPGVRWYDRSRRVSVLSGHARSYMGLQWHSLDRDLDPRAPTLFEAAGRSALGAMTPIRRGLARRSCLGVGPRRTGRFAWAHFAGGVERWLALDREMGDLLVRRVRRDRPALVFAAFHALDKSLHAAGESPLAARALATVDDVARRIRADAERDGRWRALHLWVVSDHGHAAVHQHDDLAEAVSSLGFRVRAHPWAMRPGGEVAVMVSGNAMAHLYVELQHRHRPFWPALRARWEALAAALLARPSIDLLILPHAPGRAEVRGRGGAAMVERHGERFSYVPHGGDPLGVGRVENRCAADALDATRSSEFPDAIVQIASIADSERAGDLILSASPGWDLRRRYEPVEHRSSHGALRRAHMCVPLLLNRPPRARPWRTVDVMPSALRALGALEPPGLDGRSFI